MTREQVQVFQGGMTQCTHCLSFFTLFQNLRTKNADLAGCSSEGGYLDQDGSLSSAASCRQSKKKLQTRNSILRFITGKQSLHDHSTELIMKRTEGSRQRTPQGGYLRALPSNINAVAIKYHLGLLSELWIVTEWAVADSTGVAMSSRDF